MERRLYGNLFKETEREEQFKPVTKPLHSLLDVLNTSVKPLSQDVKPLEQPPFEAIEECSLWT